MKMIILLVPGVLALASCDKNSTAETPKAVEVNEEVIVVTDPPPADTTVSSPPPPPPPAVDYAPFASIDVGSCPKGQFSFDASASRDDNGIVTYIWNFGDGSAAVTAASPYASHKYGASGTYTVSVTVKDAAGQSSTATATIKLKNVR